MISKISTYDVESSDSSSTLLYCSGKCFVKCNYGNYGDSDCVSIVESLPPSMAPTMTPSLSPTMAPSVGDELLLTEKSLATWLQGIVITIFVCTCLMVMVGISADL